MTATSKHTTAEVTMIFRLTQELARRTKQPTLPLLPLCVNPYADWSAHIFPAGRIRLILVVNSVSLYPAIFPAKGITSGTALVHEAMQALRATMYATGDLALFEKMVAPDAASVQFSTVGNRRLTGSMNEMAKIALVQMYYRCQSPFDAGRHLTDTIMSYIGNDFPVEVFRTMHKQGMPRESPQHP